MNDVELMKYNLPNLRPRSRQAKQKPGFIIPFGREDLPGIAMQIYVYKLNLQHLF